MPPRTAPAGSVRGWPRRPRRTADEGSATVTALGVVGVLVVLLTACLALASASVAGHRARSAADLAALAAAQALAGSSAAPCAEASRIAERQGAVVRECRVDGADVELVVAVTPAGAVAKVGDATARARAGPEADPGSP